MNSSLFRMYNYTKCGKRKVGGRYVNKRNEDCRKADIHRGIFITADGMGGRPEAKITSLTATMLLYTDMVDTYNLIKKRKYIDDDILNIFKDTLQERNKYINAWSKLSSADGCGTTIDGVLIDMNKIYGVHVGDGTVYKINTLEKNMKALTSNDKDKIYGANELGDLERDIVYSRDVPNHIGLEKVKIDTYSEPMLPHDIILMVTDGFTKKVHPDEILDALTKNSFDDGINILKEFCNKPQKMKEVLKGLAQRNYNVATNIFYDDTTFIAIKLRDQND